MHVELSWLPRFLGRSSHLTAFDAGKKQARQALLAGMALTMHGAKIEKLIAERVALLLLRENILQREGQFAQTSCLRPTAIALFVPGEFEIGKKTATAVSALFKTSLKLV